MIQMGIVEWLIKYLNHFDRFSSGSPSTSDYYGLEYSTALFMNLCLHKSGKQKCLPMAKMVLEILAQLLASDTKQVMFTYYKRAYLLFVVTTTYGC